MSRGPFQPGDQCNQYRIVRPLGRGGFGCVYEAHRKFEIMAKGVMQNFGQRVALKALQLDQAHDAQTVDRLNLEAVLLMELKHDNIVGFLDWGITEAGVVYFVMDLLQGKTLALQLKAGRFSVRRALYVASEMADGLAYAHEKGVTHRDLKPANVFVTDHWEIKVLDLGAARYDYFWGTSSSNTTGQSACTIPYAAPEQLNGSKRVDHRADVFALGVITYEMLTGEHPFRGTAQTMGEYVARQLQCRPRPLLEFGIPDYVAAIVHRALSKEREERYPSMAEMVTELRDAFTRRSDERKAGDLDDLGQIPGRREVRARMLQADESDPGAKAIGPTSRGPTVVAGPAAHAKASLAPTVRMLVSPFEATTKPTLAAEPSVVLSEQAQGSADEATAFSKPAVNRESALATGAAQSNRHPTSEKNRPSSSSRKFGLGWALLGALLVLPGIWGVVGGVRRASNAQASETLTPPLGETARTEGIPSTPISTVSISAAQPNSPSFESVPPTKTIPAMGEGERPAPVANAPNRKKPGQKKQVPGLYGIHVPRWNQIATEPATVVPGDLVEP